MARQIDTDAVINSIRLAEQAGDVVAVTAGYWHLYAKEGGLYVEDDNEVVAGPIGTGFEPGGRLTLTTATPVTTADVTAAATLYYTPYKHNMISLFDGARWIPVPFTEKSLSLVGYTASKPYDIWGYLSSGTLALESTIWTDGTTRATALAYQNGRLVKNGAATRRYLGTIYINSSGGQTDDSVTKRNVWNYHNRKLRQLYRVDATSHSYTTGAARYWNNDATIKFEIMVGVQEDAVLVGINSLSIKGIVWLGFDGLTAVGGTNTRTEDAGSDQFGASASQYPGIGYHYYTASEYGVAGATQDSVTISGLLKG